MAQIETDSVFNWSSPDFVSAPTSPVTPIMTSLETKARTKTDDSKTQLAFPPAAAENDQATKVFGWGKEEGEDAVPVPKMSNSENKWAPPISGSEENPVLGWLVCVSGPDKGKDYCLCGLQSTIGRGEKYTVSLTDPTVSSKDAEAAIIYDNEEIKYYLKGGGNVRLNKQLVIGNSEIKRFDKVKIGDDDMIFIPFCSESFAW